MSCENDAYTMQYASVRLRDTFISRNIYLYNISLTRNMKNKTIIYGYISMMKALSLSH